MPKKKKVKTVIVKSVVQVPTRSPFVYVPPEILAKIETYIACAKGEISGLATVERYGERDFLVTELYLLKQKCSPSQTTLDPEGLAQFAYDFVRNGGDMSKLKVWWHSHANFGVSWSQDDERTIQGFQNEWLLSIVGNKAGAYLARLDVFSPVRVTDRGLLVRSFRPVDAEQLKEIEAEIAEKVTVEVPKPVYVYTSTPQVPGLLPDEEEDLCQEGEFQNGVPV